MQKAYILPHDLGQSLISYLQTKPWAEVNQFIVGLNNIQPVGDPPKPEGSSDPDPAGDGDGDGDGK